MTPSRRSARTIAVVSLAGVALLAGCSSDDASTETGDGSTSTADVESTTTAPPSTAAESTTTTTAGEAVATDAVEIKDYAFNPPAISVAVGTTVTWTNGDDFKHTTTSDSEVWDSGPIEPGAGFSQTFAEAGTYAYFCNIHNYMEGEVVVE